MIRFSVGADFAAGALLLSRRNIVAVAGVVPSGQEKVTSAVVTTAGRVPYGKTPVKFFPQKVCQAVEGFLLRIENFVVISIKTCVA